MSKTVSEGHGVFWILVDHSEREASFLRVAEHLRDAGHQAEIVTMTDFLGSAAKDAISGSAERLLRGLRVALQGRSDEDFLAAVRRARPDVLVVTDPRYLKPMGLVGTLSGIDAVQVGVLPDYHLSAEWSNKGLRGFVVPHADLRERLIQRGVHPDRVLVAGPPVQKSFEEPPSRQAARHSFKFDENERIVLVRAVGLDSVWQEKIVFQATLVDTPTRFIFHHNGDTPTASVLRRAAQQYGLRALMFGHVPDLERYVAAADLIVCPMDEKLTSELVAADRAMLIVGAGASSDEQTEFLRRTGAARTVDDVLRLGTELDACLTSEALALGAKASAELSASHGSRDVADALGVVFAHRDAWRVETVPQPSDQTPSGPDDTSAFEEIGADKAPADSQPEFTGIGMAEARDQLARLILDERELERKLDESSKQQERWRSRLNLAREWNESDLATEAEQILRAHRTEADRLATDLQKVRQQKLKLKAAAHGKPTAAADSDADPAMEGRFRKMEMENDLESLKDRIRRELGE